jgi:hypothetical protein
MKKVLNFCSVFGVLALCLKYYFGNKISLELAALILIGSVILLALDKPIWQFIKGGVALFSFGLLLVGYTYNINDFKSLLQPIMTLLIALFGIFIIVRGVFKSESSNDEEHFIYNKKTGKLRKKNSWW